MLRPIRPSRRNELWYREQLGMIVGHLRTAGAAIAEEQRPRWPFVGDAEVPGLEMSVARAAKKFGNIQATAERLSGIAVKMNLQEVDARLVIAVRQSLGIDVSAVMHQSGPILNAMREKAQANIDLIKSIPEQYLAEVRDIVSKAWVNGTRWETMRDEIAHVGDVTEYRAKVIARDQTSKMNAAFNQVRQTDLGIEEYEWSGAMDSRERQSHRAMEGTRQKWREPPMVDGEAAHPGEPILCRCLARPVFNLDAIGEHDPQEATG